MLYKNKASTTQSNCTILFATWVKCFRGLFEFVSNSIIGAVCSSSRVPGCKVWQEPDQEKYDIPGTRVLIWFKKLDTKCDFCFTNNYQIFHSCDTHTHTRCWKSVQINQIMLWLWKSNFSCFAVSQTIATSKCWKVETFSST